MKESAAARGLEEHISGEVRNIVAKGAENVHIVCLGQTVGEAGILKQQLHQEKRTYLDQVIPEAADATADELWRMLNAQAHPFKLRERERERKTCMLEHLQ